MDCVSRMQQHLLLFRRLLGWSAEYFGEEIGVTRQTINNIESGRSKLTKSQYIALRKVIDEEIVMYPDETQMLSVLLYILIDYPNELKGSEIDKAVTKANLIAPSIISGTASRGEVSDEWVSDNEDIVNKVKKGVNKMVNKRLSYSSVIEENYDEIKTAIYDHFKENILSSERYDLWLYVDDDGSINIESLSGYYRNIAVNKKRILLFSCGGENMTAWNLLRPVTALLDYEDRINFIEKISHDKGVDANKVTIMDLQNYIQENHPRWIEEWLEEYFYDDYGYIDEYVEGILDRLIDDLEVSCEEE